MDFIEGCPHARGGLYEGFHCAQLGGKRVNMATLFPHMITVGVK